MDLFVLLLYILAVAIPVSLNVDFDRMESLV